ncbi:2Fe-2S iron-sulfur cluster-binding protein [Marinospirillum alkaliphilum]|uniref:CDP-4-dehydro-6-deoxyglucose reductase n=1 Tax=Marinospirillum alkaliphilum DSM 21637 TaxID=1122209 RepID=A0A1K1TBN0_9GAMM|nr:2Fe-2S iron-sulfur cluster-binding protein [Marinospirillum alkaliphilum]SFW97757.1 CDP-4-dehydro-6-deoxyglucose reductase [Marinospirillum alkaliphilum DSM 21637]
MQKILLHPSGREVECTPGDTVLAALEKKGYALPNNCRAGACGECKVKVLSGQFDQGMVLDMALSQEERKQGFGLMCMAKPLSDELIIEWGTEDAKPKLFPPRENQRYIISEISQCTPRIRQLRLRPIGPAMRFWPGQYVTLGDDRAGAPPRCYSIANAPRPDGEIQLQITQVENGKTSNWVHQQLKLGDMVKVNGPYGTFIGDPTTETPVLCLAAGSGLAPILSLTEAALRRDFRKPVTLMFSARTEEDLYELGMMKYWEAKHRNFNYKPTLTEQQKDGYLHGLLPEVLPQTFKDLSQHSIFISGSPGFVDACIQAAKALGAKDEMIHTEGYFDQAQPQTAPASHLVS